LYKVKIS